MSEQDKMRERFLAFHSGGGGVLHRRCIDDALAFATAERELERAEVLKRASEGAAPLFAQTEAWLREEYKSRSTVGVHRERLTTELDRLRAIVASQAAQIDELRTKLQKLETEILEASCVPIETWGRKARRLAKDGSIDLLIVLADQADEQIDKLRVNAGTRAERELAAIKAKHAAIAQELSAEQSMTTDLKAKLALIKSHVDDVWLWQGDGHDHPESLSCPVVMSADTLRKLVQPQSSDRATRVVPERTPTSELSPMEIAIARAVGVLVVHPDGSGDVPTVWIEGHRKRVYAERAEGAK